MQILENFALAWIKSMKLVNELFLPSQFTLLTAPVAAGKTKLIIDFYQSQQYKMIFVSPLRALANEVYSKLSKENKNVFLTGGKLPLEECFMNFLQSRKSVLIATMELLNEEFLEACFGQSENIFFVLDEFHLFYHWGEQFRPILHDRFLAILETQAPVLGITATMSQDLVANLNKDLAYHHDYWFHLDFGNHQLHRAPRRINYFSLSEKARFSRVLWKELRFKRKESVFIVFCSYRSEVEEMVTRSNRLGIPALGCVGGEVELFLSQLDNPSEAVEVIFSTTTLSHGVNLPEIKKVFINYEVKNFDFWLQMVGRGGRQGAEYEVYCFDHFLKDKRTHFKDKMLHLFSDFVGI